MKKFILIFITVVVVGCTNIGFQRARKDFQDEDYQEAIENFDKFINSSKKYPLVLKSKLYRSHSLYALGKQELNKGNFKIAADYFYLANSEQADSLLDDCYYELANHNLQENQFEKSIIYLDFIVQHLKESNLMPQVLYTKLKIQYENFNKPSESYENYVILAKRFPDSESYLKSKKIVNKYMPDFLENVKTTWRNDKYSEPIEKLLIYLKYPADYKKPIKDLIGDVYFSWGENLLQAGKLVEASQKFKTVLEYDSEVENQVDTKLRQICDQYIATGDQLLKNRDIEGALEKYRATFNVIKGYQKAEDKIAQAEQIRENIEKAKELIAQGDQLFSDREYKQALSKYQAAYSLDNSSIIATKIEKAKLWVKMENQPHQFAKEIINNYNNGELVKKINKIARRVQLSYSSSDVRITPWQIMRSPSRNNYEVRYSIFTPQENFLFFWLVKLETQKVIPLNNVTEELMKND